MLKDHVAIEVCKVLMNLTKSQQNDLLEFNLENALENYHQSEDKTLSKKQNMGSSKWSNYDRSQLKRKIRSLTKSRNL